MFTTYSKSRLWKTLFYSFLLTWVTLRGLNLSSSLMPFEGWDEYQHIAVIDHVANHGVMPDFTDQVAPEMWDFLCEHPHPRDSAIQLHGLGCETYDGKIYEKHGLSVSREQAKPKKIQQPPNLYQAQQAPAYYHSLAFIKRILAINDYLGLADIARIINVILMTTTIGMWCLIFRIIFINTKHESFMYFLPLVIASNSLYVYNAARVSNDTMVVCLTSIAIAIYYLFVRESRDKEGIIGYIWVSVVGIVSGLAVLSKGFAIILLPAFSLALLFDNHRLKSTFFKPMSWRPIAKVVCFVMAYGLVAGWYHYDSLQKWGSVVGQQEIKINAESDTSLKTVFKNIVNVPMNRIKKKLLDGFLHQGGWSLKRSSKTLSSIFSFYTSIALLGLAIGFIITQSRMTMLEILNKSKALVFVLIFMLAAALYKLGYAYSSVGRIIGITRYTVMTFPIVCLFLMLWSSVSTRLAKYATFFIVLLFSAAYYKGTLKLLTSFTPQKLKPTALASLLSSHHDILSGYPLITAMLIEIILLFVLLYIFHRVTTYRFNLNQ